LATWSADAFVRGSADFARMKAALLTLEHRAWEPSALRSVRGCLTHFRR
jgi:hypothetical protein